MQYVAWSAWWPPILQTAIGGLLAIGAGAFSSWFAWQKERQSVAAAFAAEVQGVIDFLEWPQVCENLLQGQKFLIGDPRLLVFKANVGKIGLLPADLAPKDVGFYNYAEGILQDFAMIEWLRYRRQDPWKGL
jgi:hypothetical protein